VQRSQLKGKHAHSSAGGVGMGVEAGMGVDKRQYCRIVPKERLQHRPVKCHGILAKLPSPQHRNIELWRFDTTQTAVGVSPAGHVAQLSPQA